MKLTAVISTLNSKYIHSSLAPWCLLAGIRKYGLPDISPHVIEGTINEYLSDVCKRITERNPDVVGFCCYIWNIRQTVELISMVKEKLPDSIIILGGPEVSYNQKQMLENNQHIDYILSGEGEKPFALLLNAISSGELNNIENLPGLSYRNSSGDIIISEMYISDEEPPSPYTDEYFESLKGRIAYLETSRGCPYSCAFCLSGRCGNVRFFDIERAKKELISLANSGAKTIKLVDRTFNANKKRACEIFEFIIDNCGKLIPEDICFHFEIAGDILDSDTINLLKKAPAGLMQLEIGLQSFNEKTLSYINRKTNTEKLKSNISKLIQNANMHIHIDLIAGLPFEDITSFEKSFNIAYAFNPNMLQLGFLKLIHGSDMRENSEKYPCVYSETAPYEVIETPWISSDELKKLHSTEDALERMYNSGRFRRTLNYLISECGYEPFELFMSFGLYADASRESKKTLDEYTKLIYTYFLSEKEKNIDSAILRDMMVLDRIATNPSGYIPDILKIEDENLRRVRIMLDENPETKRKKGIRRGVALLYSDRFKNSFVYADYERKNPVTGEYQLHIGII